METVQGSYPNHATHSSRQRTPTLSSNHEATLGLELLMDLMLKADLSKYQDILGYLHYCLPSDDQAR